MSISQSTRYVSRRASLAAAWLGLASVLGMTGAAAVAQAADPVLAEVISGDWRSASDRARDTERRPSESLVFWGLEPGDHILEVQPGAGWWTHILAPYAARTGGQYVATAADLDDPNVSEGARRGREAFATRFSDQARYGSVGLVNWGANSAPLPVDRYDFILVSRSIHGWMRREGALDRYLSELSRALKRGGTLAIEQHRANPGPQDPQAATGYVTEAFVIEAAERAGFKLVARSELNANPKDTKDHPFGVWTLPPQRATVAYGSGRTADPNFDRTKYDAIGESDRMTLRFTKE